MKSIYFLFFITILRNGCNASAFVDMNVPDYKNVFDLNLYESVLDPELCEEQIRYIRQNDQDLLLECK